MTTMLLVLVNDNAQLWSLKGIPKYSESSQQLKLSNSFKFATSYFKMKNSTFNFNITMRGCLWLLAAATQIQLRDLDLAPEATVHVRPGDDVPVVRCALLLQPLQLLQAQHSRPHIQSCQGSPAATDQRISDTPAL
jgi:hypothetical protein